MSVVSDLVFENIAVASVAQMFRERSKLFFKRNYRRCLLSKDVSFMQTEWLFSKVKINYYLF